MMHIPHQQPMPEAQQRAAAIARRARLMGPQKRINLLRRQIPMQMAIAAPELPLWQRERIRFDFHVLMFKAEVSPTAYMQLVAALTGVRFFDNTHDRHNKEAMRIKNETCYHLKAKFGLGVLEIGKLMRADHSTICRRINVHCAENGIPLIGDALSHQRNALARELYDNGMGFGAMARIMKASVNTIRNLAIANGWYVEPQEAAYRKFIATVDRKKFEAMILVGFSMRKIQRTLHGSPTCILRLCDEMGLVFNGKGG